MSLDLFKNPFEQFYRSGRTQSVLVQPDRITLLLQPATGALLTSADKTSGISVTFSRASYKSLYDRLDLVVYEVHIDWLQHFAANPYKESELKVCSAAEAVRAVCGLLELIMSANVNDRFARQNRNDWLSELTYTALSGTIDRLFGSETARWRAERAVLQQILLNMQDSPV